MHKLLLSKQEKRIRRSQALRNVMEVACHVLSEIQQNDSISHRELCRKVSKTVNHVTLKNHLEDMRELSLIERTEEAATENSQTRHLKPGRTVHYRITDIGRDFVTLISNLLERQSNCSDASDLIW